jgi:4-amino-4-deoxy-L-arabinose transferase-like glycosyltransferase
MKKQEILLLSVIIIFSFIVRLYRFNNPIADWHSWRQADTSSVSRNFILHGFDVLHPMYDDISNVQSGKDNPHGYRFVEFPLYNIFQGGLYILFHSLTLEEWGRMISIFSSLLSLIFLFLLGKKYGNTLVGFASAIFFGCIPYNIYYSRTILPDPSMVMTILGGIYFFSLWIDETKIFKKNIFFIASVIFTSSSFLLKPYALFFTLPFLWIVWKKWQWGFLKHALLWLFMIVTITPLILWRFWIIQFPEGIPANMWLFNGGNIRFTGAYFYWIFAERISKLLLGYWGITIVFGGLISFNKKNFGFFLSFLFSSLVYLIVIARGNVQHDYYQILIIPTFALFFGLGLDFFLSAKDKNKLILYGLLGIVSIFSFIFGWYQVRDYFNINNYAIVTAGNAVSKLTPTDAKIIAPYNGDTSLLYQTQRKGWPSFEKSLLELIAMGADFLVLVNPSQKDYDIGKTYKIVSATSDYILFNLHKNP